MATYDPVALTGVAATVEFREPDSEKILKGETLGTVSHGELIVSVSGEEYYVEMRDIVNYYPV